MSKGLGSRNTMEMDTPSNTKTLMLGSTTQRVTISQIDYSKSNSKHYNFTASDIVKMIKTDFGEDFDIFSIPLNADSYSTIDSVVDGKFLDTSNQKLEVSTVLEMARDYAKFKRGDSDSSEPPTVRVMLLENGRYELLQGNKRTMAKTVIGEAYIEVEKPRIASSMTELDMLIINARENETQKKSTFSEIVDQVYKELNALASQLNVQPNQVGRALFVKSTGRNLNTFSQFYQNIANDDELSFLARKEFFINKTAFVEFKAKSVAEQIDLVKAFSMDLAEQFVSKIHESTPDQAMVKPESPKKSKQSRSISLPKIKNIKTAQSIVKAVLNSEEFKHLKGDLLPNGRVPGTHDDLQKLIEKMFTGGKDA
jgi:hypothetical protein